VLHLGRTGPVQPGRPRGWQRAPPAAGDDFDGLGAHSLRRANINRRQEVGDPCIGAFNIGGRGKLEMASEHTFVELKPQNAPNLASTDPGFASLSPTLPAASCGAQLGERRRLALPMAQRAEGRRLPGAAGGCGRCAHVAQDRPVAARWTEGGHPVSSAQRGPDVRKRGGTQGAVPVPRTLGLAQASAPAPHVAPLAAGWYRGGRCPPSAPRGGRTIACSPPRFAEGGSITIDPGRDPRYDWRQ